MRGGRAAAEGVTGHEKARRQLQVLGDSKPRLKSHKEITQALHTASGDGCLGMKTHQFKQQRGLYAWSGKTKDSR